MKSRLNFKVIKNEKEYDMHELGIWVQSFHVHSPNSELSTFTVSGMDGVHLEESRLGIREVSIDILVDTDSLEELDDKKHLIYDLFYSRSTYKIIRDFKDLELNVIQEGSYDIEDITCSDGEFSINLKMLTPHLCGPEKTVTGTDNLAIHNDGTAEADPIFELTATKKTTFAMVSDGTEYNIIGKPADVDEVIVDEKTELFDELGDTLDEWRDINSQGTFKSDSNGIYVNSYGTGEAWHGPQIEKEITPTEDFEIEIFTRVRTESDLMTFRTSLNFYDENMNELGMLRVWDKSNRRTAKIIEARIGPYTGVSHQNYLISSNNYLWEGQRAYNGVIRVTRKGQIWTFYAAHISQRGNHVETITKTYHDRNNEFAGLLKYLRLESSIYGDNPKPNALSIGRVRTSKLNSLTVDQTPYVLDVGDVITFDHKDEEILINGEPRMDLKNFGGSFFSLPKGQSTVLISPEDSFDSVLKYREKYL